MRQNHLRILGIASLILTGFSACGKKEPSPIPPTTTNRAVFVPSAEAEVVGTKGPLELTLRAYKTKVKSEEESLWYQVRLRNIGLKEIPVFDNAFLVSAPVEMCCSPGTSILVTGPDGKALKPMPTLGGGAVLVPGSPSWPIQDGDTRDEATKKKVIDAMWADRAILRLREEHARKLEREKLPPEEFSRKVIDFEKRHPLSDDGAERRPSPHIMLKPGAAITSTPWTDRHISDPDIQREFTELTGYWYTKPGKYRIKAIFNRQTSTWEAEYNKTHGILPEEDAVLVETEAIEFEVIQ